MLTKVIRSDKYEVAFMYDALGRRIWKKYKQTTTRWIWDSNKPLHEWKEFNTKDASPDDIITWVFNVDNFAPTAKIKGNKKFSIIKDHLGTPTQGYNEKGEIIWHRELDSYGNVRMLKGEEGFCNFTYQGQTIDAETGLRYNRFRYYSSEEGMYISQDPIGLAGGREFYTYVSDTNSYVDVFGLTRERQRWEGQTKNDGTPKAKPGPKGAGEGPHNAKVEQIIAREKAAGSEHIGGGSGIKTEMILKGKSGRDRRMDASFKRADGSIYHINVGLTLKDGKTGVKRERDVLKDIKKKDKVSFEGYAKASGKPL